MVDRIEMGAHGTPRAAPRVDTKAFVILVAFLVIAILTGGGSRPDVQSHLILRPLAVLAGAYACLQLSRDSFRPVRTPLVLLLTLAAIMLVQLLPLPPGIWTNLPGRELHASAREALGIPLSWHALTLSPAQTWNSLVALLPPLAALLLYAITSPGRRGSILTVLLAILGASAILGLAQRAGPADGPLYLYRVTNETSAVGFFSNRNHQAAMLACMFPMLATYASLPSASGHVERYRIWIAVGASVVLLPLILATGSRSGLGLTLVGLITAGFLYRRQPGMRDSTRGGWRPARTWLVIGGIATVMVIVALVFSQAEAISRFAGNGLSSDLRVRIFWPLVEMARATFPAGIGFGSFEPAYRAVEPDAVLNRGYLNNAHNDLLQWIIEGGLPALLLLIGFFYWFTRRALAVWNRSLRPGTSVQLARLGVVVMAILLLASLVDYPLRTPFVMVVFVIGAAWLESASAGTIRRTSETSEGGLASAGSR